MFPSFREEDQCTEFHRLKTDQIMFLEICIVSAVFAHFGAALRVNPPGSLILQVGGAGTLTCENLDIDGPQPTWNDPRGVPIYTSSGGSGNRVFITESIHSTDFHKITVLNLNNVIEDDEGAYSCVAPGHQTQARIVIVQARIRFPYIDEERDQRLIFNRTGTIYCTAEPRDDLDMSWTKDFDSVDPRVTKYSIVYGQLTVHNVIQADTGTYRCSAYYSNTGTTSVLDINVVVQVPPTWEVEPGRRNEVINTDVTIQCRAAGTPEPTYTWIDRTTSVEHNITNTPGKYQLSDDGEFLTIFNLQLPDIGIIYILECTASNDPPGSRFSTSISKSVHMTVLVPPTLNSQVTQTVSESPSRTVSFECAQTNAQTNADVTLSWRRDGRHLEDELIPGPQTDDSRIIVTKSSTTGALTLTIQNALREHEGIWTCFAESTAGDVYVDHILNVQYAPIIDQTRTPFRTISWEGNPTNLTCAFFGFPAVTIKWYRNQYRLNETNHIQFLGNTRAGTSTVQIIPELNDFGAYFCEGRNSIDFLRYRQELIKAARPKKPLRPSLHSITASTITVRFEPPSDDGGLPILGYIISYWIQSDVRAENIQFDNPTQDSDLCRDVLPPLGSGTESDCYDSCASTRQICCHFSSRRLCVDRPSTVQYTEYRLVGLSAQSSYIIRVAAKNQLGTGDWTENMTGNTHDFSRPDPPEIVSKEESEKGDEYILQWEPPVNNGGIEIDRYLISYTQINTPDETKLGPRPIRTYAEGTERRKVLDDVKPGKIYYIELKARNDIGESLPDWIVVRTGGVFVFRTTPATRPKGLLERLDISNRYIVAAVVAFFVVFLIVVDVCCFCVNDCGLLMFICVTCCGKTPQSTKDQIEMEEDNEFTVQGSLKDWEGLTDRL